MITSREQQPDAISWAARRLEAGDDLSRPTIRQQFLKRLATSEFLPEPSLASAFAVLDRPEAPLSPTVQANVWAQEGERLGQEVEGFAERFFQLPCGERNQLFQHLSNQCQFHPTLQSRLADLKAGLNVRVDVSDAAGEDVQRLAHETADQFVLSPSQRALRRRRLTSELSDARWRQAVQDLADENHDLSKLEPVFFSVVGSAQPDPEMARARLESSVQRQIQFDDLVEQRQTASKRRSGWVVAIGVFVVIKVIVLGARFGGGTSDRPRYESPPTRSYDFRARDEEMRRILKAMATQRSWDIPPPPGTTQPGDAIRRLLDEQNRGKFPSRPPNTAPNRPSVPSTAPSGPIPGFPPSRR